jgi:hypothetical protein
MSQDSTAAGFVASVIASIDKMRLATRPMRLEMSIST